MATSFSVGNVAALLQRRIEHGFYCPRLKQRLHPFVRFSRSFQVFGVWLWIWPRNLSPPVSSRTHHPGGCLPSSIPACLPRLGHCPEVCPGCLPEYAAGVPSGSGRTARSSRGSGRTSACMGNFGSAIIHDHPLIFSKSDVTAQPQRCIVQGLYCPRLAAAAAVGSPFLMSIAFCLGMTSNISVMIRPRMIHTLAMR